MDEQCLWTPSGKLDSSLQALKTDKYHISWQKIKYQRHLLLAGAVMSLGWEEFIQNRTHA
jgi:hypothetical protein